MMTEQKLIIVLTACLTLGAIGGTLRPPQYKPKNPPRLRGLTDDKKEEIMKKWSDDQHLKERIADYEYLSEMSRQAMKNELRVSEARWRIIEPKYERQIQLMLDTWSRSNSSISSSKEKDLEFEWIKPTEYKLGRALPKTFAELTDAERNVEKLVDLLRREDTTDEELRKQIDALQQAREKARKEWPKANQELAVTLTTPRQEAVFLLMGYID
ncbi:MAG: hypothetical protein A2Z38_03695 [Planctomycetes bacterium RBG_19FT_COMBO_48_8]|nr:MAG: hypothetical protein A2Z74_03400 [Chloroflexi bacterium RBG_13_46_9]OHB84578.1 MAG: hypothetical protein A2Z38_03695 [Planctomycetes bacterium RBG_19FT_COMBO_48_8]